MISWSFSEPSLNNIKTTKNDVIQLFLSPPEPFWWLSNHDTTKYNKTLSPNLSLYLILSFVKHQYHAKIDDQIDKALSSMTQGLINKLVSVLEATLGKLGRYDEGSLIGSLLSFTVNIYFSPTFKHSNHVSFRLFRMSQAPGKSSARVTLTLLEITSIWFAARLTMIYGYWTFSSNGTQNKLLFCVHGSRSAWIILFTCFNARV